MEKVSELLNRLSNFHKENNCIVGQISKAKLEAFYDLTEKSVQIVTKINKGQELVLSAFIEGDTLFNEEAPAAYYRGPYTFINFVEDVFHITRKDKVSSPENDNYLNGQYGVVIKSKNIDLLLLFISKLTEKANISLSVHRENSLPDLYSIIINKKDLLQIAESELPFSKQKPLLII